MSSSSTQQPTTSSFQHHQAGYTPSQTQQNNPAYALGGSHSKNGPDYSQKANSILGKYNFDYNQTNQNIINDDIKLDLQRQFQMNSSSNMPSHVISGSANKSADITLISGMGGNSGVNQSSGIWQQPLQAENQPNPFHKTSQYKEQFDQRNIINSQISQQQQPVLSHLGLNQNMPPTALTQNSSYPSIHQNNQLHGSSISSQSTPQASNYNEQLMQNFTNSYQQQQWQMPLQQQQLPQQQQQQHQQQQLTQQQQLQLLSQLLSANGNQQQQVIRPADQQANLLQQQQLQLQAKQPQVQQPLPQQHSQLLQMQQLLAQQQQQLQLKQAQDLQQQQQMQQQQSMLNTPLDSSRIMGGHTNQQQQLGYGGNNGQNEANLQPNQFAPQNYQQLYENLNQYKKLISYLENIEQSKRGGVNMNTNITNNNNQSQSQFPQLHQINQSMLINQSMATISQQPIHPHAQNQRLEDTFQNFNPHTNANVNGMYDTVNSSVMQLQPEEKLRPVQETLPLQQSFIMSNSPTGSLVENRDQVMWPSAAKQSKTSADNSDQELQSNRTFIHPMQNSASSNRLQNNVAVNLDQNHQNSQALKDVSIIDNNYENYQLNESYLGKKLQKINMDIKQQQYNEKQQQKQQPVQVLDYCLQSEEQDNSKASAENTKESLTEAQINHHLQPTNEEINNQAASHANNRSTCGSVLYNNEYEQTQQQQPKQASFHHSQTQSQHYQLNEQAFDQTEDDPLNQLLRQNNTQQEEQQLDMMPSYLTPQIIVDKPIVSHQMTFEELLESKLQEDMMANPTNVGEAQRVNSHSNNASSNNMGETSNTVSENQQQSVVTAPPKREFLRKNSNNRGLNANGETERAKSKGKYKYYVDNFTANGNNDNNNNSANHSSSNADTSSLAQKNPNGNANQKHSNISSHHLANAQSPRATNQQSSMRRTTIENSASNKKLLSTQKSNQKQPKQQNANKQSARPQSQQQAHVAGGTNSSKDVKSGVSANKNNNRQNNMTPHVNSNNTINKELNNAGNTDEQVSERNSVIEFEMLEQECIEKYNQQQLQEQQKQVAAITTSPTEVKQTSQSIQNSANKQQLPPKVDKQQQKLLESKIQELDKETAKLQRENKRVAEMQSECEAQLKRLTEQIEEFELRKGDELEDVEQWKQEQRDAIRKEKLQLEKEREKVRQEQMAAMDTQSSEVERLMARINQLESENFDLKDRLDELTDKELHCIGIQTMSPLKNNSSTMTDAEVKAPAAQKLSQDVGVNTTQAIQIEETNNNGSRYLVDARQNIIDNNYNNHHLQTESLSNPIDQITEEDEENFSKTISDKQLDDEDCGGGNDNGNGTGMATDTDLSPTHGSHMEEEAEYQHDQEGEEKQVSDDEEEDEYDLKFPAQYHNAGTSNPSSQIVVDEVVGHDGKVQKVFANGKKEVVFTNGVRREVWPDGYSIVYFNNNDVKQTYPDGKIVYYFSEAKTTQSTYPNGLQVFKFANCQIEKHFADGTKEISFPDGTIKCLFPDGEEESIFPDGTIQKIEKNGVRIVEFPSGQRDVLYPDCTKVREYEDGAVKKIYADGRVEVLQSAHKPTTAANANNNNRQIGTRGA